MYVCKSKLYGKLDANVIEGQNPLLCNVKYTARGKYAVIYLTW